MNRPTTLERWLAHLETLHPKAIAMGLERVALVHSRMDAALACPVVTVTGTGSTLASAFTIITTGALGVTPFQQNQSLGPVVINITFKP